MKPQTSSRITTDTSIIHDLIVGIKQGEIKIPQFQRKFVWKERQAIELLDSIANNYPIGSILFWKTKDKLRAERNIGEFKLPETDDLTPTDYVLDGQQRLTVIYSCLGAPESDEGFSLLFDLRSKAFLRSTDPALPYQFQMRKCFNTTQLLNYRTSLLQLADSSDLQARLDELIGAITGYRIPVVTLKDLSVNEVCPIFERINSSGTKLSTYDLMVAATWSRTFDLNSKVDVICDALEPKGYGDIDRSSVLKCISAINKGTIREEGLKSLRDVESNELNSMIEKTQHSLEKAVDILHTEFHIYSWDFLSYEAQLIIISGICSKLDILSPDQVQRLRKWFWRSSFGERYKVGGENFVSKDLEIVSDYVINGTGKEDQFGVALTEKEWKTIAFRSNVSRSRAYILALASEGPKNLMNGLAVDRSEALSIFNKKQFHHIYPKAHLKRAGSKLDENLMSNICFLPASANNKISDNDPNVYFPEIIRGLGDSASTVLKSNLLPDPSVLNYSEASYDQFLEARIPLLVEKLNSLFTGLQNR